MTMRSKFEIQMMYGIPNSIYNKIYNLIDWPDYYKECDKPEYIGRVVGKARWEGVDPEAYLLHKKAKEALLSE